MNHKTSAISWIAQIGFFAVVTGCMSGYMHERVPESAVWPPVIIDSIPLLASIAVEVPIDTVMLSEYALERLGSPRRIRLTEDVIIAFESWSLIGLLNPDRSKNIRYELKRQFAAYCTTDGRTVLAYNLINTTYRPCRKKYSASWRYYVALDTECTGALGIFESSVPCKIEQ